MRARTLTAALAAAAVLAVPAGAHAATKVVDMGLPTSAAKTFNNKLGVDVNDFFPHGTAIHVGDSIKFVPTSFHTVDFPAKGKKPLALFGAQGTIAGVNDFAGAPFWFNGRPQLGFNPALANGLFGKKATYNGRKEVDTGLPFAEHPKPAVVKFTKAGKYTFYCNVHPGMKGTVTVKPAGARLAATRSTARVVKAQVARDLQIAKALPKTKVPSGTVDVGPAGKYGVELFAMLPSTTTVSVGSMVTFRMGPGSVDVHTATFGPDDPDKSPDGYLGKLAASLQGTSLAQEALYPSDPPSSTASLTPTSHGNGFWNSGALDNSSATPLPRSGTVKFTQAGTYQFYCLIHPFMHGTVIVK